MVNTEKIKTIAGEFLQGTDLFVVEVTCTPANEIEVLIDSDTSVSIDSCVELSRHIESQLDREAEDFELTVASCGIGYPLRMTRQYVRLTGKPVEVVLYDGTKIVATLNAADEQSITLGYKQKIALEGSKKKTMVDVINRFMLADVKSTVEYIDFK